MYGMMTLNEHQRMMIGDLISHDNEIKTWERSTMLEVIEPTGQSLEGLFTRQQVSLFDLGTKIGNAFIAIGSAKSNKIDEVINSTAMMFISDNTR